MTAPRRAPTTISVNLTPAALAALQWLIDQGETVSSATRTALVALAQARGMGSADIEARVTAIEERLSAIEATP